MNTFTPAEAIEECLKRTGLNQRELSRHSKVSEVTLSRIRNGHSEGSGKTLKKLRPFLYAQPPAETASSLPDEAA